MPCEHFDTMMAFVLMITGVSVIITTLTGMVSALPGWRAMNPCRGLGTV